ncbi:MAG: hypothetical protein M5U14_12960 [Acidimicrobiia bacterium]|nr:hypothetical protein [Acidimicrobiia bacterium]
MTAPTSGVAPPPGSPPYGGSGDDTVCDREKLIAFLTGDRAKGEAWAGVRGISYADLETYVRALTPTVLLYDTRVTNHGFAGGRATPRQSVLQAGTAVLVDTNGDPVARCKCGNPLRPPTPVEQPVYTGAPWPAFDPRVQVTVVNGGTVTVIVQAPGPTSPAATEPPTDVTVPDESTSPDSTLPFRRAHTRADPRGVGRAARGRRPARLRARRDVPGHAGRSRPAGHLHGPRARRR